jgi:uncharacterized protein (TIGR00251 family)
VAAVERDGDDLILRLRVQPRAPRNQLAWQGEQLKLRITAPPVDGKANTHLCGYLAGLFGVAKSDVEIMSGETGRDKRIRVRRPAKFPACLAQKR